MKCDLHCHTFYSYDSNSSPREIVDAALKNGIDCLAITDHGEIKGAIEAIEYAKGKPILIIPGIEIKTKEGDIIALNLKEKIEDNLSAIEAIRKIKEFGGFVIIPHPFSFFCAFKGDLEKLKEKIDAIEVLNASVFFGNKKALDFAKKNNLSFVVGSDAHFPNFVGKAYLEIEGKNLSVGKILTKIKNKNVKIGGREGSFFEKITDHLKRNLVKILKKVKK